MMHLTLALAALALASPQAAANKHQVFLANAHGFTGGKVFADTTETRTWLPQNLFRYRREGVTAFEKTVPPGDYLVRINMIERDPNVRTASARVFSVNVATAGSPKQVFLDIDLWDQAGGHHVPLQHVARVHLPDGVLRIDFMAKQGVATVASVQLTPLPKIALPRAAEGGKTLENFDRFAKHPERLIALGGSDDKSGWVNAAAMRLPAGQAGLQLQYRVDASLPYGNAARFRFPLAQPIDLRTFKTLAFTLWPDGSNRRAGVVLHGSAGQSATFSTLMTAGAATDLAFSLEHVAADSAAKASDPPLDFPVSEVTFFVSSDAAAALGQGEVHFGPLHAHVSATSQAAPSPRSDFLATERALRIEGFENYPTNRDLWDHVGSTTHANVARVSLANGRAFVGQGRQSARLDYTFDKRAYSGLVFMRPMDIRNYNVFRFWLRGDGSQNKLMVFFALGQIHQFEVPLSSRKGLWVSMPLSSFLGETANRQGVVEIGLWARRHGDSQGGSIYLDDIGLAFDPKLPNTPAPRPAPAPISGFKTTRIDAGSDTPTVDQAGNEWLADVGFQFGRTHQLNAGEIANYTSQHAQVHQTFRVGMVGYAFAVPNGNYTVNLIMAENWLGAKVPGRRVCHIKIGPHDLGDVDIIASTKRRFAPLTKSTKVAVSNGVLALQFKDKANHCKVDALEIIPN